MTAIEGCVRAAAHVGSSEGLGVPASTAAAVRANVALFADLDDFTAALADWATRSG